MSDKSPFWRGTSCAMWIDCPECGARIEVAADHPSRPFCSSRCKLLDLGRWLNEEVRIPVTPQPIVEPTEDLS